VTRATNVSAALSHWASRSMAVQTHRHQAELPALAGVVGADEVAYARHDLLAPFAAVEDAVVADPRLLPMQMACTWTGGGERVRGLGLADARDVVELALDGHQRGLDGGRIDLARAAYPGATRQQMLLEHHFDRLQVEFGGEIHDGEILVVERTVRLGVVVV